MIGVAITFTISSMNNLKLRGVRSLAGGQTAAQCKVLGSALLLCLSPVPLTITPLYSSKENIIELVKVIDWSPVGSAPICHVLSSGPLDAALQ